MTYPKLSKLHHQTRGCLALLGLCWMNACQSIGPSPTKETVASESHIAAADRPYLLNWKSPGPAYEQYFPETNTRVGYGFMATQIGDVTVKRWQGYSKPLGEWVISEDIGIRQSGNITTGPIKLTTYHDQSDPPKKTVGYEVSFPRCSYDNFTIFVDDIEQPGAKEALDYVFETMTLYTECSEAGGVPFTDLE